MRFRDDGGGNVIRIGEPEVEMLGSNDAIPVIVLYNPGDPARSKIKNFRNLLLGPFILFVIGTGFALVQIPTIAAVLEKLNGSPP